MDRLGYRIIMISGDGTGAGKTSLAENLSPCVMSIADELRKECERKHSHNVPWRAKEQHVKDAARPELGGKSIRDILIAHGQEQCKVNGDDYWIKKLCNAINIKLFREECKPRIIAIDDLRKVVERDTFYKRFPSEVLTHIHITQLGAEPEPQYENTELLALADYTITWDSDNGY